MTPPCAPRPRIAGVLLAAGMGRRFGGPKALADTGDGPWVLRALGTLTSLEPRVVVVGAEAGRVRALLPEGVIAADNPDFASGMGSSLVAGLRALAAFDGAPPGVVGAPGADVADAPGAGVEPVAPAGAVAVDAAVIMLVDLPDVPAAAVERVVSAAWRAACRAAGVTESMECDEDRVPADHAQEWATVGHAQEPARHGDSVIRVLRQSLARATFHGTPGHPVLIGADHFAGVIAAAGADRGARDYLATHPVMPVECGDLAGGQDVDRRPGGG